MRKTVVLVALLPSLALAATGQRSGSQTITGATSSQRGTVRLTGDLRPRPAPLAAAADAWTLARGF